MLGNSSSDKVLDFERVRGAVCRAMEHVGGDLKNRWCLSSEDLSMLYYHSDD